MCSSNISLHILNKGQGAHSLPIEVIKADLRLPQKDLPGPMEMSTRFTLGSLNYRKGVVEWGLWRI